VTTLQERLKSASSSSEQQERSVGAALRRFFRRVLLSENFVLYLSLIYFFGVALFFPTLLNPGNLSNQIANFWPLLTIAVGQTFVLIVAGIDLSQGSIMAITSVIGGAIISTKLDPNVMNKSPLWGWVLTENGGLLSGRPEATLVAVIVMLAVGMFIGFLNGTAIARFNMPPFMVTLVSLLFFSSFAIYLTQSRNISNLPEDFLRLGQGDIVSVYLGEKSTPEIKRRDILPFVTYPATIAIGLAVAGQFILRRTVFGQHIYAIGNNRKTSAISGVPTRRVITLVYVFSGFCAALAAIIYSARLGAGRPTLGEGNFLLDIIGATVIGGTSLFGGKGKVTWTFFGVVFFTLLLNTLNQMRLSAFHIDAVKGGVILLAALIDVTRTRLLARERL
jgi:ribose/xylose/arabinose/galactoside ABC-type transport system permease subunit